MIIPLEELVTGALPALHRAMSERLGISRTAAAQLLVQSTGRYHGCVSWRNGFARAGLYVRPPGPSWEGRDDEEIIFELIPPKKRARTWKLVARLNPPPLLLAPLYTRRAGKRLEAQFRRGYTRVRVREGPAWRHEANVVSGPTLTVAIEEEIVAVVRDALDSGIYDRLLRAKARKVRRDAAKPSG